MKTPKRIGILEVARLAGVSASPLREVNDVVVGGIIDYFCCIAVVVLGHGLIS